ncbi:nickel transporter [Acidihalobacter aeolianus]|uniref:Nickel/cobalt efflux system n=1 Tax=Acidihalobacter aeolianus TaxID=2792603 RepID=A0A1D8K4T5_9GAMM|nr:HoxN/HupN/NixA family nickel/cobalt transporter [Acidihalobacter aeolianus]AOV15962.1 nickel transporter [Acidihalobacter aeolianus]
MSVTTITRRTRPSWVIATVLVALNLLAWGLLAGLGRADAALLGIGALAFGFGLRHAFDADHIAAIDNVTRKLRQDGQRPLGVGLFFSLGHSTVVFGLTAALVLAVRATQAQLPMLQHWGGLVSTLVSAGFLTLIGLVNLFAFSRLWRAFRACRRWGEPVPSDAELESLLQRRGLFARLLRGVYRRIDRSWKMYPVGLLFGLGFDTASEIAILGISAAAAQNGHLPLWGVMVFPLLFTAAMSLMDTLDGIVMLRAYDWALADAERKLYFNTALTGLSVLLALAIGMIEWLQLLAPALGLRHGLWASLETLDFSQIGVAVTVIMLSGWALAFAYYRRALTPART